MSRQREKGTRYETSVARWLRDHGVDVERRPMAGSRDRGDLGGTLCGLELTVECKDVAAFGPALVRSWRDQTDAERGNAGADVALLVTHIEGNGDGRRGRDDVHVTVRDLVRIVEASGANPDDIWVRMTLDDVAKIQRGEAS
jgi:hypothetical protein